MLIYRHWVIMAYSKKLSDIIVLGKCEVYSTKKPIQLLPKPKSKKGHNSVKKLQMTFKFELDLYFMMFYPSVKLN